ncbi:MAG: hypothetical protein LBU83_04925 [Bacteroidales bacterium]|nr:hypothetical protein [Bacteroidales bacterium]
MKKYSFLIYYKTYNEFLETIRQAGVVHIVEKQNGIPDDATDLRSRLTVADSLKNTILTLQRRLANKKDVTLKPLDPSVDGMQILARYEDLKTKEEQLNAQKQTLQKEIAQMTVWGNFEPEIIEKLQESGHHVKFYACRDREFQAEWTDKFDVVEVARINALIYFVTVTPAECTEEPDAEKMKISDRSLNQLQELLNENQIQIREIESQIDLLAVEQLENLLETQRQLTGNIDLDKVHLQTEKKAEEKLMLLEGWVPEKRESELICALETQDVYYLSKIPDRDDHSVPILLKNNWFARLFEPIGELYDFPNYHELDLTPFFAPFYMLFFGLCLGDAGYGLLLLFAGLFAKRKVKPSMKPIMTLVAVLGAATFVCGTIGGTLFGISLVDVQWQWLDTFKKFMLDSNQLFNLALILGGVQIIFGMFVKAFGTIRRYGFIYSLEIWGWLILFLGGGGLYFATEKTLLAPNMARYLCYIILGIAGIFIFILNDPKRNPLINIGAGLWNTYNMVTGVLGDLLSYIRLFALGICGGVMGFVFNDLAIQLSGNIPVVSQVVMLIILLVGHLLNLFMSGLGAFVHPMRLTFVEFYKNAGFEGGGKKYKPFKKIEN